MKIDIAQLREAWTVAANYLQHHRLEKSEFDAFRLVGEAFSERLAQREAGALIITPDENGQWPEWARTVIDDQAHLLVEKFHVTDDLNAFLDVLRDAMPDGLLADPRDFLTSEEQEALQSDLVRLAKSRRDAEATARDLPLRDAKPDGGDK